MVAELHMQHAIRSRMESYAVGGYGEPRQYAGVRPSEALALRFGDVGERTLLVERSLGPDGSLKRTKTGQIRSFRLLAPLREDLIAWRKDKAAIELVFLTRAGAAWDEDDWRNWRHRVYAPAAAGGRPCRHAAVRPATQRCLAVAAREPHDR